jgi:beta-lactamase regulating signal transducer with metallopeptidase domain
MILVFIEAAVRSFLVGLAVALGLRIFRVRNVLAQKAVWNLVLVSALAMPLLLPIIAQLHLLPEGVNVVVPADPVKLLEEMQARLLAGSGSGNKLATPTASITQSGSPRNQESPISEQVAGLRADKTPSRAARTHRITEQQEEAPFTPNSSASSSAQLIVHSVSSVKRTQSPIPVQHIIVSPVVLILTLYCGIAALFLVRLALGLFTVIRLWRTAIPVPTHQLPYDAASLQIRASSKVTSPLTIGSAILLPTGYTTWDSEKLRIVLAHERSHIRQGDFYLQLFAGLYAALVWFSPLGWWLKHELAELAEAISDRAGMEEATSRTSYAQILLEFAATSRQVSIGVAMARPGSLSRRIERLLNDNSFRQCFAGGRRALVAVALVPLALLASTTLVRVQAAGEMQSPSPAATPTAQAFPQLPVTPAVPAIAAEPKAPALAPASEMIAAAASPEPVVRRGADGMQEGGPLSFDRTLSVSGATQLAVSTGSGNIHIRRGSGNQIHIHGQIHVNHEGSEEQARQIAANPPIEQNGDMVQVGQHQEQLHGISIDYEIEAPAGTLLAANSGSGNIVDEGVGHDAKLQTGSGDIRATSLEGAFTMKTGSGNIVAEQSGQGGVIAETGSGNIQLKDIHGSFYGQTGSGDIKASGTPSASWTLQTGSGNIELWTGNAPLTLDASTGSGSVSTEHQMTVQGAFDHHHILGTLNGGGPTIRVQTGSGDIHIH